MVGQEHLLARDGHCTRLLRTPVGQPAIGGRRVGKTTLAYVMSQTLQLPFEKFNVDSKQASCKSSLTPTGLEFVLLLDEIHRLTKPSRTTCFLPGEWAHSS